MIDKVNRFFSFLARQHYYLYILTGVSLSLFIAFSIGQEALIHIIKRLGVNLIVLLAVLIGLAYSFLKFSFYKSSELGSKKLSTNGYGYIIKDLYFPTKISSDISSFKKTLGYLYVIFRVSHSLVSGLVIGVGLFMMIISGG